MQVVVFDLDAIWDAQQRLRELQDTARREADRHSRLHAHLDGLLPRIAAEVLRDLDTNHGFDPFGYWERWGLDEVVRECRTSHITMDDVRGQAADLVQRLHATHGNVVGAAIAKRADDLSLPAVSWRAVDAALDLLNLLQPGNLLWLAREPWALTSRIQDTQGHAEAVADVLARFRDYLEHLWQREETVIASVAAFAPAEGPLLFGAARGVVAFSREASASPALRQQQAALLAYLSEHFTGHVDVLTFDKKHKNPLDLGASANLDGALLPVTQRTQDGAIANMPIHQETSIVVGALSGGIAAQALGKKSGPEVGIHGEFAALQMKEKERIGSKAFGFTRGTEVDVLSVDGSADLRPGEVDAGVGASLITARESLGVDVAGANVGVEGALGLKWEWGFKVGKVTEARLPFVTLGFNIGAAE